MTVDLHCHTIFSVDGRRTPEDLVDAAAARGVTTLAITEHNNLGSLERARQRAEPQGLRTIAGVEIDGIWRDENFHVLAFGFDPDNQTLRAILEANFSVYERNFALYLEGLQADGYTVSREELIERLPDRYPTHPAPVLNQWFAREVLIQRGVFADGDAAREAIVKIQARIRAERGPDALGKMAPLEAVRDAVHQAGGVLLLAHVAQYRPDDRTAQRALIRELLTFGLDGFELYHPLNLAGPGFDQLMDEARAQGCALSGGSDCHDAHAQEKNRIGACEVPDTLMQSIEVALKRWA